MTKLVQAISLSKTPNQLSRMSSGPARNWTKILLGNWRRRPARIPAAFLLSSLFGSPP
jgi:hypothetical protein